MSVVSSHNQIIQCVTMLSLWSLLIIKPFSVTMLALWVSSHNQIIRCVTMLCLWSLVIIKSFSVNMLCLWFLVIIKPLSV